MTASLGLQGLTWMSAVRTPMASPAAQGEPHRSRAATVQRGSGQGGVLSNCVWVVRPMLRSGTERCYPHRPHIANQPP